MNTFYLIVVSLIILILVSGCSSRKPVVIELKMSQI